MLKNDIKSLFYAFVLCITLIIGVQVGKYNIGLLIILCCILYLCCMVIDVNILKKDKEKEIKKKKAKDILLHMNHIKDKKISKKYERCKRAMNKLRSRKETHEILGDKSERHYEKVLTNIEIIYKDDKIELMKDEIKQLLEELEKYLKVEFDKYREYEIRKNRISK